MAAFSVERFASANRRTCATHDVNSVMIVKKKNGNNSAGSGMPTDLTGCHAPDMSAPARPAMKATKTGTMNSSTRPMNMKVHARLKCSFPVMPIGLNRV